jgi:hypothetical protein
MTEEQILEGNKLIAEFMGWELVNINDEPEDEDFDCWVFRNKITGQSDSGIDAQIYNKNSTLPFHADWNLLMTAVEKCVSEIQGMGYDARGTWLPEHGYVSNVYLLKIHTPKEIVWQEVIKHINRYKK